MVGAFGLLLVAICTEVVSTAMLVRTDGFRAPGWSAVVLAGYAVSVWLLSTVVRTIPVSIAYAVWSGLGTAAIAAVGVVFLGERFDLVKAVAMLMIIGGVVVLNLHAAH
jgi:small multidrug resistance pump